MKTQPGLWAILLLIVFGCDDLPIGFENNIGPSALSGKPPILKISYTEVAQRKAEFAKGTPKDHNPTYIEEPRSERKKVYIEIYADLTYGKQVQFLPPDSDFPADRWTLPDDMPEVKKIIYSDGFAKGYDNAGNLLLEEPFEETYWIDPAGFSSVEAARNFLLNSYFKPKANASETLNAAKKFSNSFSISDEMAVATNTFSPESDNQDLPSPANLSSSAAPANDEVVQEKNYFLPNYGVVYRTEGYTADGSLKDIEQHFYKFTKDSAFVMYILQRGPILSKSRTGRQKFKDFFSRYPIVFFSFSNLYSNLIRLFGNNSFLRETQKLADNANKAIFNRFNPNNPSVRDLAENSSYLHSIRNFQSSQAKIIAWGNEDSPVLVRLMASSKSLNPSSNRKELEKYNDDINMYQIVANGIRTGWGILCWRSCMRRRRAEKEAWHAGADYLRRGSEIAWNELTGARYLEEYSTTELTYVCDGGGTDPFQMIPFYRQSGCSYGFYYNPYSPYSYTSCNPCRWEYKTVTRHRWVNSPSDGMIKASSQKGEVSNWHGGERKFVELKGVNHMEMGVHEQSDKLFRDAFNGEHGDFFRTAERR